MSLTEDVISESMARLIREQDRFQKFVNLVASEARSIVREHNIPATVQARVKSEVSLAGKLRRYIAEGNEAKLSLLASEDAVFRNVGDICGVRIATYVESDRQRVVALVEEHFDGVITEYHDKVSGYRATHCQVALPRDVLSVPTYANLEGVKAEIQVTSMLAHAWNEIEHAMRYKSSVVEPNDPFEISLLSILLNTVHQGNSTIDLLLMARSRRVGETLVPPMAALFPNASEFTLNGLDVLTLCARLGATDVDGVRRLVGTYDLVADSKFAIDKVNEIVLLNGEDSLAVREETADSLFALLVVRRPHEVNALLSSQPPDQRSAEQVRMLAIANLVVSHADTPIFVGDS